MTLYVAFLRAVNVAGHGRIKMAELKALCEGLGFTNVVTLLQSGNVVFSAKGSDSAIATKLAAAIDKSHGFRPAVVVRTAAELTDVMARNPFPAMVTTDPGHLLVAFMGTTPDASAKAKLAAIKTAGEEIVLSGRDLYLTYPHGIGTSKLTSAVLERAVGAIPMTARNWNTLTKLVQIAEA